MTTTHAPHSPTDDDFDDPFSLPFIPRATPGLAGHRADDLVAYCRDAAAGHVVGVTPGTERSDLRAREAAVRRSLRGAIERDDVDDLTLSRSRRALGLAVLELELEAERLYGKLPWTRHGGSTEGEAFALWGAPQLPALVVRAGAAGVRDPRALIRAALTQLAKNYARDRKAPGPLLEQADAGPTAELDDGTDVEEALQRAVTLARTATRMAHARRERIERILTAWATGQATAASVIEEAEASLATAYRDVAVAREIAEKAGLIPAGPTAWLPRAKAAA